MSALGGTGDFRIQTTGGAGASALKVAGELDSGTCAELVEAFERIAADLEDGASLSLDMQDVSFIDSTGMRSMIELGRLAEARGIALTLVPPPDDVTELLRTAGIAERMKLEAGGPGLGPDFVSRVEVELEREPAAPSRARAEVREALAPQLEDSDVATVVLLTSELVTNAVVHPKAPRQSTVGLRIAVYEDGARVEVEDGGEGFDPAAPTSSSRHGGRGLFLVDACAASWGAERTAREQGSRFCVWFEFRSGDREAAALGG